MNGLQEWAMTICITLAGAALFSMLVPNSSMKKVATFSINLFLLTSLISPIITSPPEFDFSVISEQPEENEELNQLIDQQVDRQAEIMLEQNCKQLFEENGTKIDQIKISINRTEETPSVEVSVWADSSLQSKRMEMEQLIQNQLGVVPQIIYTG